MKGITKMKTLSAAVLFLALTLTVLSQNNWVNTFNSGGTNPDDANYHAIDNQGNTYVTGYSAPGGYPDGVLVKVSPSGNTVWSKYFYGYNGGNAIGRKILIDQNNNIFVFSEGESFGNSNDFFLHKFDSNGNLLISVRHGDPAYNETFGDAIFDNSGNIVVAISGRTPVDTLYRTIMLKYDKNCMPLGYGTCEPYGGNNYPGKLIKDLSGNIFVIGSILYRFQQDHALVVILKLNTQFQQIASSSISAPLNSITFFCAAESMLNTDIIVCASYPASNGEKNMKIQKLNNNLTIIWDRDYNIVNGQSEFYTDMKIDNYSNIYLSGYSNSIGDADAITVKLDIDGNMIWNKVYDRSGNYDEARKIAVDGMGNVYTGGMSSSNSSNFDAMILKYNAAGVLQFEYNYNGQAFSTDLFSFITVTSSGIITASGRTTNLVNNVHNSDIFTVRLDAVFTGTGTISSEIPSEFSLSQNYPNPFNPSTTIGFNIPSNSKVNLVVFNSAGQQVAELVNENLNAGTYEYKFDAGKLTSGVYFYRLTTDNFTETKKMILVK